MSSPSLENRIAVPLQQPIPSQPSLIPADVLSSYEQELQRAEHDEARRSLGAKPVTSPAIEELAADELLSAEFEVGLGQTTRADPKTAAAALGQVALFNGLAQSSTQALLQSARQGELGAREYLFLEGDLANSFFVIIQGTVEVLRHLDGREVVLRHMGPGEAIGLFGLFSGQLRAASARAIDDVILLEIPAEALGELLDTDTMLHERLLDFYRERLLEGFLGTSRLFLDVDSIARARLIGRFAERTLDPGQTLVHPGEVSNLLLVVLGGSLLVEQKAQAGVKAKKLEVTQGQFLAVTSALSGSPCRARIYAPGEASIAVLAQKELADMLRDYPALRALPSRLSESAELIDRDIYVGHTGVPGL